MQEIIKIGDLHPNSIEGRIYDTDGISPTLTTPSGGAGNTDDCRWRNSS